MATTLLQFQGTMLVSHAVCFEYRDWNLEPEASCLSFNHVKNKIFYSDYIKQTNAVYDYEGFKSVVAVVYQSVFCSEMHQNNIFLNYFLYQHIKII